MPTKAMKYCQRCGKLASAGNLCDQHRKSVQKFYDRNSEHKWHLMYITPIWLAMRAQQLANEPLCCECLKHHTLTPATVADHIVPHKGDSSLFYNPDNLQSMCASCHSIKTDKEEGGFGNANKG